MHQKIKLYIALAVLAVFVVLLIIVFWVFIRPDISDAQEKCDENKWGQWAGSCQFCGDNVYLRSKMDANGTVTETENKTVYCYCRWGIAHFAALTEEENVIELPKPVEEILAMEISQKNVNVTFHQLDTQIRSEFLSSNTSDILCEPPTMLELQSAPSEAGLFIKRVQNKSRLEFVSKEENTTWNYYYDPKRGEWQNFDSSVDYPASSVIIQLPDGRQLVVGKIFKGPPGFWDSILDLSSVTDFHMVWLDGAVLKSKARPPFFSITRGFWEPKCAAPLTGLQVFILGELISVDQDGSAQPTDSYPHLLLYDVDTDSIRKMPVLEKFKGNNMKYVCGAFRDKGKNFFFAQLNAKDDSDTYGGTYLFDYQSQLWTSEMNLRLPGHLSGGLSVMPVVEERPLHMGGKLNATTRNPKARNLRMVGNDAWVELSDVRGISVDSEIDRDLTSALWVPLEALSCTESDK